MREIFPPAADLPRTKPLHDVFYTVTAADVGRTSGIRIVGGTIPVGEVLGRVQRRDVGRRIYAVLSDDKTFTVWQAENDAQRDKREAAAS